ncbi:sex-regulated protein janus-B [Drosophila erecta]|uniref:Sex-regulated protein janus-B n=2 Tax=Drosophila erecta TaxID=7220 RepID=B3P800_DROER|nr:sex-regulated protein janus-B [Drosophila erecta]EDV53127.1 ocnus [Drosophila erecta]
MKTLNLLAPVSQLVKPIRRQSASRVNALLINVPRVQLSNGKNKYLLMMIHMHGLTRFGRTIVRGSTSKDHEEIFEEIEKEMDKIGICTKCLGGGFISNKEDKKVMKIYGCCKTFGEAPHGRTKDILLSWTKFQHYNIILPKRNMNAYQE